MKLRIFLLINILVIAFGKLRSAERPMNIFEIREMDITYDKLAFSILALICFGMICSFFYLIINRPK